jgi:hypothetical protein
MNGLEIMAEARQRLRQSGSEYSPPICKPFAVSPWIAMSLLQKSIRRGNEELALRAAATLLMVAPDKLWRRCGGIAFEDIGIADIETVSLVTAALAGMRYRETLGGGWKVASFIVSRMVQAAKCRAADDLLMCAELHPALVAPRKELPNLSTAALLGIVNSVAPLPEKALALWYALGTDRRPSVYLKKRRGEPQAVFDFLCDGGYPHSLVEMSREGFRKIREVLCPFVSLLYPVRETEMVLPVDDSLPPEIMIGEIPSWALDMYSREGRAALLKFLRGPSETAGWVRALVPPSKQLDFLGGVVFRVEGGLVRKQLQWPTGNMLRRSVDIECHGSKCDDGAEVLQLMRQDLDLLNEVRANVS